MDHKSDCFCWRCWFQDQTDKGWLLIIFGSLLTLIIVKSENPNSRDLVLWAENVAFGVLSALLTMIVSKTKGAITTNTAVANPAPSGGDKPSTVTATVTTTAAESEEEKK